MTLNRATLRWVIQWARQNALLGLRTSYWRRHANKLADELESVLKRDTSPKIVCLCGSTRFYQEFQRANYEETMKGNIVLSVGFCMHSSEAAHGESWGCTPEQKLALDELHKQKIEFADEIYVLNVGGYIGESTANEIAHAKKLGRPIRYLE